MLVAFPSQILTGITQVKEFSNTFLEKTLIVLSKNSIIEIFVADPFESP
jgi:hypothetical protein